MASGLCILIIRTLSRGGPAGNFVHLCLLSCVFRLFVYIYIYIYIYIYTHTCVLVFITCYCYVVYAISFDCLLLLCIGLSLLSVCM